MSFILDALRKSENERQQQAPSGLATVPSSHDSRRAPRWLWLLAGLLVCNVLIASALLLRTGGDPPPTVPLSELGDAAAGRSSATVPSVPSPDPSAAFADQLEQARRNRPPGVAPDPSATTTARASRNGGNGGSGAAKRADATSGMATLPSLDEVRLSGKIPLPEMRIDLHVYSAAPERRFVSINGKKYRQRDTLTDGPTVREITAEGVILDYQGTAFVLMK